MPIEGGPDKNESLRLPDVNQAAEMMNAIIAVGKAHREYRKDMGGDEVALIGEEERAWKQAAQVAEKCPIYSKYLHPHYSESDDLLELCSESDPEIVQGADGDLVTFTLKSSKGSKTFRFAITVESIAPIYYQISEPRREGGKIKYAIAPSILAEQLETFATELHQRFGLGDFGFPVAVKVPIDRTKPNVSVVNELVFPESFPVEKREEIVRYVKAYLLRVA